MQKRLYRVAIEFSGTIPGFRREFLGTMNVIESRKYSSEGNDKYTTAIGSTNMGTEYDLQADGADATVDLSSRDGSWRYTGPDAES